MTSLERNGDLVHLASYAPLLGKNRRLGWEPDLIYFDNANLYPTINYYVQQLFSVNAGDQYLPGTVIFEPDKTVAASCVRDSKGGEIIIKLVSRADAAIALQIDLVGTGRIDPTATCTVISGDPLAENNYSFWHRSVLMPVANDIPVAESFVYDVPPHSLSVIRIKSGV
jgi:alpha-L-arabinofuranosidase